MYFSEAKTRTKRVRAKCPIPLNVSSGLLNLIIAVLNVNTGQCASIKLTRPKVIASESGVREKVGCPASHRGTQRHHRYHIQPAYRRHQSR